MSSCPTDERRRPTFRQVRRFTPRFLFNSPGTVNRFVLTVSAWPLGPDVNPLRERGAKSCQERLPRARISLFLLFLFLSFPFFLNFLAAQLRWRSISRWAAPAFALVKLKFRNFLESMLPVYTKPGRTANKIDLGCTFYDGGEEGKRNAERRGGVEENQREDKVKLKAVGQVRPYCWPS